MSSLPPIIDIRDDLNRARQETDQDVTEEFETVRDRLDAFADRNRADREGVLDEIDNELLRIEELLDGEAARDIRAARNRIHVFRDSLAETDEDFVVVDFGVRQHEESEGEPRSEREQVLPVGEVTMTATVANSGEDAEVVPVVTFYDETGEEIESVRGSAFDLPEGAEEQVEMETDVPEDAAYNAVSAVEASA
ncbi:DUF7553 family protein [Halorussus ruber]|uniref:DUF7553 family protein n=1 Tax=Halorussus ruber TaxID=1126238 RepID=UPI001092AC3C|nr:hypothetical protein [Halorussus ruber]